MSKNGLTLVEILIVTLLTTVVMGALFLALRVADISSTTSETKIGLTQEASRAMDWMVKDLRQTNRMRLIVITALNPEGTQFNGVGQVAPNNLFTDPRFPICLGYNQATEQSDWSDYEIQYSFDTANSTIIRTDSSANTNWLFHNITNLEFTSIGLNQMNVAISATGTARDGRALTFNLTEEIRLRN
jgi:Tfp pilus assembly protein PilW